MIQFIIEKFIKDYDNVTSRSVIKAYGYLCGVVGIISNTILSVLKIMIGLYAGSIAVVADAVNNITDVGSSAITIAGFAISDKPADKEHPFGHARAEYITALAISVIIMFVGLKFFTTSIERIRNPKPVIFSMVTVIILVLTILAKFWQGGFYQNIGDRINSNSLRAVAADSRSDVLTTIVVLISIVSSKFIAFPLDGYVGLFVSIFIFYNGIKIASDAINPLLGAAPDEELVNDIIFKVESFEGIEGSHDLIVHNYGLGKTLASIHAEVCNTMSIIEAHDIIDKAEKEISKELNIEIVIHMDPINCRHKN